MTGSVMLFRFLPIVVFAALVAVFALALRQGEPQRLPTALLNKPVPAVTLAPLDSVTSASGPIPGLAPALFADGKPTVVNFWASWCAPCIEEHPVLIALVQQTGVRLVGINHKDAPANARRFLSRYGNPFAAIGVDPDGAAAIEWGVTAMPETFIVDAGGRVVHKHTGAITPQALQREIVPALQRAARTPRS